MVRRRADYHLLKIMFKTTVIFLILSGTNGDSKQDSFNPAIEKYISPFQSREYANYNSNRFYPSRYGLSSRINKFNKEDIKDRVIFPDEIVSSRFEEENIIENPPTCEGRTYCDNVTYYPTNLVKDALMKNLNLTNLSFKDDVNNITQRVQPEEETSLCSSNDKIIYPKTAETRSGEWRFVVQMKDLNFEQGMHIEECGNTSTSCKVIMLPMRYESKCVQRYIYRKVAVLMKKNKIDTTLIRIPSSCCCIAVSTGIGKSNSFDEDEEYTV